MFRTPQSHDSSEEILPHAGNSSGNSSGTSSENASEKGIPYPTFPARALSGREIWKNTSLKIEVTTQNSNEPFYPPSTHHIRGPEELPSQNKWTLAIVTFSLCLGTFLVALDTMIIGTAIPSITSQFHSLEDISWYGSAYLLTNTALQPSFGKLYKLFRIKMIYLLCVVVFEVGSIICAAAPSSAVFIVGRAIAGCGAAGLLQGALAIIANTVPLAKRPIYMGIVISVFGISVCIGPVLGGAFTQHITWRWCFWINVPIGGTALLLIAIFLRLKRSEEQERYRLMRVIDRVKELDPLGASLLISAICCLFLALQWGGQSLPWNSSKVIGLFAGFGVLIALFCFTQVILGEDATIPIRVLKQRSILCGSLFLFFMAVPSYIYGYYLPIYFQTSKGSSATYSGAQFMALAVSQIFFVVISGAVATKWGYYAPYMVVGTAISAVGSGLLTMLKVDTPTWEWALFMVICGIGTGLAINLPYTAVQVVLSKEDAPIGNAISQFAFQLGAAISLSIGQNIFLNKLIEVVPQKTPSIPVSAVVAAGAYDLRSLAPTPALLHLLREAYALAIRDPLIYAVTAACLGLVFACGMEHKNIKAVEQSRMGRCQELNTHGLTDSSSSRDEQV
ncbi:MFS general substrate transporter [Mollisia scopiformis]|uniref:MFS general substrate transporter n=1 Tax=Mollisia scopiformis TaxID=149040 RepID=A0A194WSK9_MOLSC|nr:MFS general substrate transporter [Mollisia scopiformis]KUJ10943.1 MFS general substrate transporter [Mollisia scopiformis]